MAGFAEAMQNIAKVKAGSPAAKGKRPMPKGKGKIPPEVMKAMMKKQGR